MGESIRIGMGQMLVESGKIKENLSRAEKMIAEAGSKGCNFIVLPECLDLGWTFPEAAEMADSIPGKPSDILCSAAAETGIYVVAGLTEKAGQRIYNSALLISPAGKILAKHRKINILNIARNIYSIGNMMGVTETEFGTIGMDICSDNFPAAFAIGHTLARMGADIILSPASWAVPPENRESNPCEMWERSYISLAGNFGIPVIGVSNIGIIEAGIWKDYRCIGNSLAVSAEGKLIAKGSLTYTRESLILAEVVLKRNRPEGTDISPMLIKKGFTLPEN